MTKLRKQPTCNEDKHDINRLRVGPYSENCDLGLELEVHTYL